MKIQSKRFGTIEVREDRILTLKGGLLGFSNMSKFALLDDQVDPGLPFKWLVSIEDPEYGFLVTDPGLFFKDYIVDLSEDDRKELDVNAADEVTIITLLTVPSDARKITANLKGPLIFNNRTCTGKQIILANSGYATKHYIFLQTTEATEATDETNTSTEVNVAAGAISAAAGVNTEVETQS